MFGPQTLEFLVVFQTISRALNLLGENHFWCSRILAAAIPRKRQGIPARINGFTCGVHLWSSLLLGTGLFKLFKLLDADCVCGLSMVKPWFFWGR